MCGTSPAEKHKGGAFGRLIVAIIRRANDHVSIAVEDDGRGFDPDLSCTTSGGGIGILGMLERLDAIGGTLFALSWRHF